MLYQPEHYFVNPDAHFPNNKLPVILYRAVLKVPAMLPVLYIRALLKINKWGNSWSGGIRTCHHYHSTSHEVMAVYRGSTMLQLGGEHGIYIRISKGDVIMIPAGVAYKNVKPENSVAVVGAFPRGTYHDMNLGNPGERPAADINIQQVPLPECDPVGLGNNGLPVIWALSTVRRPAGNIAVVNKNRQDSRYKTRSN